MSQHLCSFALLTSSLLAVSLDSPKPDLVVHEWGTFTSVAGPNGDARAWLPLNGPSDLPSFVYHLRDSDFKGGLLGTVRMETPVLYFYSPRETEVSVKVEFPHGLITEWYPTASKTEPKGGLGLRSSTTTGRIQWASVKVMATGEVGEHLPMESANSHYYAARNTAAANVRVPNAVGMEQAERFLFYRGVAGFQPPLSVKLSDNHVVVQNRGDDRVGAVIVFQNHNGAIGYGIHHAGTGELRLELPESGADVTSLRRDFERLLVAEGLFPDEAHAMLETWRDTWFEKGTRVFYVLSHGSVDRIVPLSIEPKPAKVERVFVGRIELLTPETNPRFHVL